MSDVITTRSRSVSKAASPAHVSRQVKRATTRRATKTQAAAARRSERTQVEDCAVLLARCEEPVSEAARTFYDASVSDDAASRIGKRYAASPIVDDWITVVNALLPSVLAGQVKTYGPMRARYAAELAGELAARLVPPAPTTHDAPVQASVSYDSSFTQEVAQGLRTLGFEVVPPVPTSTAKLKVSHSLEQLADVVRRAQASVPADVMANAGLTPAVLNTLATKAREARSAHTAATVSAAEAQVTRWTEDVLAGRLARETRLLVAAARISRKANRRIPKVRSGLLARPRKKVAKAVPIANAGTPMNAPTSGPAAQPAVVAHAPG